MRAGELSRPLFYFCFPIHLRDCVPCVYLHPMARCIFFTVIVLLSPGALCAQTASDKVAALDSIAEAVNRMPLKAANAFMERHREKLVRRIGQEARAVTDELLAQIDRFRLAEALVISMAAAEKSAGAPATLQKWLQSRAHTNPVDSLVTSPDFYREKALPEWGLPGPLLRLASGELPAEKPPHGPWAYFFLAHEKSWVLVRAERSGPVKAYSLGSNEDWQGAIHDWYAGLLSYHCPRVLPKTMGYEEAHRLWLSANEKLSAMLQLDTWWTPGMLLIPDGPLEYFSWSGLLRSRPPADGERDFLRYDYRDPIGAVCAGFWQGYGMPNKEAHARSDTKQHAGYSFEVYQPSTAAYDNWQAFREKDTGPLPFAGGRGPGATRGFEDKGRPGGYGGDTAVWAVLRHVKLGGSPYATINGDPELPFEWYSLDSLGTQALIFPATEMLPGKASLRRFALSLASLGTHTALFTYWQIPGRQMAANIEGMWDRWISGDFHENWLRSEGRDIHHRPGSNLFRDPYFTEAWMLLRPADDRGSSLRHGAESELADGFVGAPAGDKVQESRYLLWIFMAALITFSGWVLIRRSRTRA